MTFVSCALLNGKYSSNNMPLYHNNFISSSLYYSAKLKSKLLWYWKVGFGTVIKNNRKERYDGLWKCCSDAEKTYPIIILGGGVSAGYAAFAFVYMGGQPKQLAILSEESVVPYERPTLSKGFLDPDMRWEPSQFYTCAAVGQRPQDWDWYQKHGIDIYLNTLAIRVDIETKKIYCDNNCQFQYDKLIIATGCRPRQYTSEQVPFSHLDGIFYLRNIEDARILRTMVDTLRGEGKAAVMGGGYLAMEVTSALVQNDIQVTMAYPGDYLLNQLFPIEVAQQYEQIYEERGVVLLNNCFVDSFYERNDGFAYAVRFKDGRQCTADFFVVCIGAVPNIELFQGQLRLQNGGIQVNHRLQAVDHTDIYAMGDVASFPLTRYWYRPTRIEHVDHCRKSAANVILDILHGNPYGNTKHETDARLSIFRAAEDTTYEYTPFYYCRIFDLCWKFYGDNSGKTFTRGQVRDKMVTLWIELSSKVVGVLLEGGSPFEDRIANRVATEQPKVDMKELENKKDVLEVFDYLRSILPTKVERIRTKEEEEVV